MMPPRKREGARRGALSRTNQLCLRYRFLFLIQLPFECVFWWLEQRRSRIHDRLSNLEGREA